MIGNNNLLRSHLLSNMIKTLWLKESRKYSQLNSVESKRLSSAVTRKAQNTKWIYKIQNVQGQKIKTGFDTNQGKIILIRSFTLTWSHHIFKDQRVSRPVHAALLFVHQLVHRSHGVIHRCLLTFRDFEFRQVVGNDAAFTESTRIQKKRVELKINW